jgi:hypothetical protein
MVRSSQVGMGARVVSAGVSAQACSHVTHPPTVLQMSVI